MKSLFQAFILMLFIVNTAFAFEPFIPESAVFNFSDRGRITLERYNEIYLASSGEYEDIEFDESDASFGERLTLTGFSVEECYKIAIAAYVPEKYHGILPLPQKAGVTNIDNFSDQAPFYRIETKAEFNGDSLNLVKIVFSQEGGDHFIEVSNINTDVQIEYLTSLP